MRGPVRASTGRRAKSPPSRMTEASSAGRLSDTLSRAMLDAMRIIIRRPGPETIDMTPDGRFIHPPATPIADRVFRYAVLAAIVALGLSIAAVFAWFALMLLPVALGTAAVAWLAWRWRMWRAGRRY